MFIKFQTLTYLCSPIKHLRQITCITCVREVIVALSKHISVDIIGKFGIRMFRSDPYLINGFAKV
jgi:hypothetical protein